MKAKTSVILDVDIAAVRTAMAEYQARYLTSSPYAQILEMVKSGELHRVVTGWIRPVSATHEGLINWLMCSNELVEMVHEAECRACSLSDNTPEVSVFVVDGVKRVQVWPRPTEQRKDGAE